MTSWASIAKATVQPTVTPQDLTANTAGLRLLVVDANAIIAGIRLEGLADRAVTIQEVFNEIRDKQSRQFLASLPYHLQISEPTEESVKTVTRFARETGDVSTLSANDVKLLALAHTLEVTAHGAAHLAAHAAQPRMHSKAMSSSQALPGWGSVPNPEDWKAVDEANEADETAAAAASTSRIAQQVQQLSLDHSQPNSFLDDEQQQQRQQPMQHHITTDPSTTASPAALSHAHQQPAADTLLVAESDTDRNTCLQQLEQDVTGPATLTAAAAAAAPGKAADGGWEVAASSAVAARRKKRKEYKRAEKQRAFEAEWEEHSRLMQQQQQQQVREEKEVAAAAVAAGPVGQTQQQQNGAADEQQQNGALDVGSVAASEEEDQSSSGSDDNESDAADASTDDLLAAGHQVYTAEDVGAPPTVADGSIPQQQQQQHGLAPGVPGWQSSVACITADFAMQNVLLQMGLRLLTPDGRRITRLSRYALRCSACFTVTREPGRLFCPKCGNMTLDRVEVVVGADGAEYYGIRKKHILRGTKYSLPKPRGGRNSQDPVLREDVFLLKVKALGRRAAKKKPTATEESAADPFAPEFSQDTWHVASQAELAQNRGLAAVLQPAWKNNPNERKWTRSNRRG